MKVVFHLAEEAKKQFGIVENEDSEVTLRYEDGTLLDFGESLSVIPENTVIKITEDKDLVEDADKHLEIDDDEDSEVTPSSEDGQLLDVRKPSSEIQKKVTDDKEVSEGKKSETVEILPQSLTTHELDNLRMKLNDMFSTTLPEGLTLKIFDVFDNKTFSYETTEYASKKELEEKRSKDSNGSFHAGFNAKTPEISFKGKS